jgi:hypothetical protein
VSEGYPPHPRRSATRPTPAGQVSFYNDLLSIIHEIPNTYRAPVEIGQAPLQESGGSRRWSDAITARASRPIPVDTTACAAGERTLIALTGT